MRRSPAQIVDEVLGLVLGGLGHLEDSRKGKGESDESTKDVVQLRERIQILEIKVAHLESTLLKKDIC